MKEYHKIDSVYKRDGRGKFIIGEFSRPEFEYLKDNPWQWTEKIDGTNTRVMYETQFTARPAFSGLPEYNALLTFGGKSDNASIPAKLVILLQETFTMDKMFEVFGPAGQDGKGLDTQVCLYGEGYGAGIQKGGGNYSPNQKFILFDVKIGEWWLERKNVEDIASKLGIDVVPLVDHTMTLTEMIDLVSTTDKDFTPRTKLPNSLALIEGWVGTPAVPLFARNGDRIITKIKYKDFR